ncbi:DUF2798 domain-containing protein [Curtobacterium flaccumfaciens]|uniref:DUF2798 domain-containing protein n=1 Tax=Curtobacterium flaccumfaciens TaxID=2035 RepID=UPI00188A0FDB|nr:DUF2798 domain-containing protein [Curtobacterium flaccumfaciens]MBF4595655.1 DUF2798 domain-containing protein [Curtobacterium flaccumfaciens]
MLRNKIANELLFALLNSILVTIPLGFVLTVYNLGFGPGFGSAYLVNSIIAVVVSTPASLVATRLVSKLFRSH